MRQHNAYGASSVVTSKRDVALGRSMLAQVGRSFALFEGDIYLNLMRKNGISLITKLQNNFIKNSISPLMKIKYFEVVLSRHITVSADVGIST